MRYERRAFSIHLTDDEGRLIQNAIHVQIAKAGWDHFFTDLKTDGDSIELIDVYRKIEKSETIIITSFQLYLVRQALRKAYNKYHLESLGKLIEDMKEIT